MIVVDSSLWVEHLRTDAPSARISRYFSRPHDIFTPTVVLYEVFKKIRRERSASDAERLIAQIYKTKLVSLTEEIALCAANVSLEHDLPMADSIVYATAELLDCKVVTMDNDFHKLPLAEVIR